MRVRDLCVRTFSSITKPNHLCFCVFQLYVDCEAEEQKFEVLSHIYENISVGQSIVFLHKKETLKQLAAKMQAAGHVVSMMHGELEPKQRDEVM